MTPVVTSGYGTNRPAPTTVRNDLSRLLADPVVDRITYESSSPREPAQSADPTGNIGSHFATLTRNDEDVWVLHDRGDLLQRYAHEHGAQLRHTPTGPALIVGNVTDVGTFLAARFDDAPSGSPAFEWFASTKEGRANGEEDQARHLIAAARRRRATQPGPMPQQSQGPGRLEGPSNEVRMDRSVERFFELLTADFDQRRVNAPPLRLSEIDKEELVTVETVHAFTASFPCTVRRTRFNDASSLALLSGTSAKAVWDEHAQPFLQARQRSYVSCLAALSKYRRFLRRGDLLPYRAAVAQRAPAAGQNVGGQGADG
jgi:hypothetical protein